jgi:hypothetical protein
MIEDRETVIKQLRVALPKERKYEQKYLNSRQIVLCTDKFTQSNYFQEIYGHFNSETRMSFPAVGR